MTSGEKLIQNMEYLYENIFNLLKGFQQANTGTNDIFVPVKIKHIDKITGKETFITENVKIQSFDNLLTELRRLDNNFNSLTNEDNISYLLEADGSIQQITKTSYINAEYLQGLNDYIDGVQCITDKDSFIKNLVFPNVKIPVELNNRIKSPIYAHIFDITYGWDKVKNIDKEELTILKLRYMFENGDIICNESNLRLLPEKQRVSYFGKFSIINIESNPNNINEFKVELNDVKYEGLNTFGIVIELKVNDVLVDKDGLAKFQITEINTLTKRLTIKRIAGSFVPKIGVDNLLYNEILDSKKEIVGIPVQPKKQMVVFLSTENHSNISYPSRGIKIDSSNYRVNYNNQSYTIDEFFTEKVINFSSYFEALLSEQTIPFSLGIKPNKPLLEQINFNVVQINKHITNEKSRQTIESLNIEKNKIKNRLDYVQNNITSIQNELDTLKFKSIEEKNFRLEKIQQLRIEKNSLEQNLLTVSRNIDNNAIDIGLKKVKPKYRILGAWNHQQSIFSPLTKAQHIIKYEVQYRYLSKNVDVVDSTNMKLISDGKEITFVYSPWIIYESRTLQKIKNPNGTIEWETLNFADSDTTNINQVSIPITENESVEIRVRAISEAGYPISPIMSDWSDILRINFPTELTENSLTTIVNRNEADLLSSEFNNILKASGVLNHIAFEVQESEKLFFHRAEDITSGFYTPEQKNISLFEYLKLLKSEIDILKKSEDNKNIDIELIDFNKEIYKITNNSTIELFGGNYSDNVNLIDNTQFGTIIRKQGMIRIKNNNQYPIDIKSLQPSNELFDSRNSPMYYNVPVRNGSKGYIQERKQIFYFRNVDITKQNQEIFQLVKNFDLSMVKNWAIDNNQFTGGSSTAHDFTGLNSSDNIVSGELLPNADFASFIGYSKELPMIKEGKDIKPELLRVKNFTNHMKALNYQIGTDNNTTHYGFKDMDFYLIGKNSTGAFLYPIISNPDHIKVNGDTSISTFILQPNSEIIIPFIWEYRMMDRKGKIYDNEENSKKILSITDELQYQKKIGFSMLINNSEFNFDISVYSKLNSPIKSIEKLNVNSVTAQYVKENPSKLEP